jgi:hypothetical protein
MIPAGSAKHHMQIIAAPWMWICKGKVNTDDILCCQQKTQFWGRGAGESSPMNFPVGVWLSDVSFGEYLHHFIRLT